MSLLPCAYPTLDPRGFIRNATGKIYTSESCNPVAVGTWRLRLLRTLFSSDSSPFDGKSNRSILFPTKTRTTSSSTTSFMGVRNKTGGGKRQEIRLIVFYVYVLWCSPSSDGRWWKTPQTSHRTWWWCRLLCADTAWWCCDIFLALLVKKRQKSDV